MLDRPLDADRSASPAKGESLSVRKAITLLRLFGQDVSSLTLREIVEASGYPKTVCHRLLATLVAERFLTQSKADARYSLGPDLMMFARRGATRSKVLIAAEPILEDVAKETGDVALLHVLDSGTALCLARKDGDYPIRTAGVDVGDRLPLHCGGGPMALLAFALPGLIEDVLAHPLEARTPKTLIDPDAVRERIEQVKLRGFAIGDQDAFEHVVAVGAPIFDDGKVIAALAVGGIKPRYSARRIAMISKIVMAAAGHVTDRINGELRN